MASENEFVEVVSQSDVGQVRPGNQDSVYPTGRELSPAGCVFLCVADGIGGAPAGDVASRLAIEAALEVLGGCRNGSLDTPRAALREMVEEADIRIRSHAGAHPGAMGLGTTFVGAFILPGGRVVIANVGDSRAYRSGRLGIQQLTRDQTVEREMLVRGASPQTAVHFRNVLHQFVGGGCIPEITETELGPGEVLLVCSDGLTNTLSDDRIQALVTGADTLPTLAHALVDAANVAGGLDNVTVCLARRVPAAT